MRRRLLDIRLLPATHFPKPVSAAAATRLTPAHIRLVTLLALLMFISYVDRGSLAIAAPLIKDELHLSSTRLGFLLSAFFWSFTPSLFLAGWLTGRFGPRLVLTVGVALWSTGMLSTGFAAGLSSLFACRLLLGVGESAAYPCLSTLFATELSVAQRGRANGVTYFGQVLGPAAGTWIGGMVAATWGWRPMFIVFGALSLLWIVPWRQTELSATHAAAPVAAKAPIPMRRLLRERALWGTTLGLFCANFALYFLTSWLPIYLVKMRGLSMREMAQTGGAIFVVLAISGLATGWLFDRMLRAGANRTMLSKTFLATGYVGSSACIVGIALAPAVWAIPLLYLNEVFHGVFGPIVLLMSQTIAGPRAISRWMGLQLMAGSVAGVVAPVVTGIVIDMTGNFSAAFGVDAVFLLLGALVWTFVVRDAEPLQWESV